MQARQTRCFAGVGPRVFLCSATKDTTSNGNARKAETAKRMPWCALIAGSHRADERYFLTSYANPIKLSSSHKTWTPAEAGPPFPDSCTLCCSFTVTMVAMQRGSLTQPRTQYSRYVCAATTLILAALFVTKSKTIRETVGIATHASKPQVVLLLQQQDVPTGDSPPPSCPYKSFQDLTDEERYPSKGARHMVSPPKGGLAVLVCCETTAGPWSIVVHEQWAPRGARRFLEMVQGGYFDSRVPLMRCIQNYLCQFGLSSDPQVSKYYRKESLKDDPNWLPEGRKYKQTKGVKRFAKGYLAYAGSGENSRNVQLIVSLQNVGPLGGGSPWEVPWGELVGAHSFETLDKIYTGYGDDGPPQGKLMKEGMSKRLQEEFPMLDYVTSCQIVDREVQADDW